jgi:hypothetical protein
MGKKENLIKNDRCLSLKPNERLFRINAGRGWVASKKNTLIKKNKNGSINVFLKNARPLHAAPTGWPDLSGWTEIEITADMVGEKIAIFTGEEIKASGKLSKDQIKFKEIILRMGGIFRVLKS